MSPAAMSTPLPFWKNPVLHESSSTSQIAKFPNCPRTTTSSRASPSTSPAVSACGWKPTSMSFSSSSGPILIRVEPACAMTNSSGFRPKKSPPARSTTAVDPTFHEPGYSIDPGSGA